MIIFFFLVEVLLMVKREGIVFLIAAEKETALPVKDEWSLLNFHQLERMMLFFL